MQIKKDEKKKIKNNNQPVGCLASFEALVAPRELCIRLFEQTAPKLIGLGLVAAEDEATVGKHRLFSFQICSKSSRLISHSQHNTTRYNAY